MTKKRERQTAILDLVERHVVGSQEDLRRLLLAQGMDVTQATLSRDLRDLGVARVPTEEGGRYALPGSHGHARGKCPPKGSCCAWSEGKHRARNLAEGSRPRVVLRSLTGLVAARETDEVRAP